MSNERQLLPRSLAIPKSFKNLGLQGNILSSHIAWDIGSKQVCLKLTKLLNQSCFLSNFSRLVIDPNRKKNVQDLIAKRSFDFEIPGNKKLNLAEKNRRIKKFYDPYHMGLAKIIDLKKRKHGKVILISIHSFTKKSPKFDRGPEIGLLWNKNMNLLLPIQKKLISHKVHIGRNYPYSGFYYNHTLDYHSRNGILDNISIEIRNDLICHPKGIKNCVRLLYDVFRDLLDE